MLGWGVGWGVVFVGAKQGSASGWGGVFLWRIVGGGVGKGCWFFGEEEGAECGGGVALLSMLVIREPPQHKLEKLDMLVSRAPKFTLWMGPA